MNISCSLKNTVLNKIDILPFLPLTFLHSGKIQTIAACCPPYFRIPSNKQHIIQLSDGDQLVLIENRPLDCLASQRIILLVHGLAGSSSSPYMTRVGAYFLEQGYVVMRLNLRGCGPGKYLARYPYHAGRSEDTRSILLWLAERFPAAPVTQIGFSLGGNITLKMLGEEYPVGNLDSAIAVSAPLDLEKTAKKIMEPVNKFFHDHFMERLIKHVQLNGEQPPLVTQLYDFDNLYTSVQSGFKNAREYYKHSSSGQFLNSIKIKTLVLFSEDDPFIVCDELLSQPPNTNNNIDVIITEKGGHVGWLASPFRLKYVYWMDKVLLAWVKWLEALSV